MFIICNMLCKLLIIREKGLRANHVIRGCRYCLFLSKKIINGKDTK